MKVRLTTSSQTLWNALTTAQKKLIDRKNPHGGNIILQNSHGTATIYIANEETVFPDQSIKILPNSEARIRYQGLEKINIMSSLADHDVHMDIF